MCAGGSIVIMGETPRGKERRLREFLDLRIDSSIGDSGEK